MSLCVLAVAQFMAASGLLQPDVAITIMPGAGDYVQGDTQSAVFVILENNDVDRKGRVEATLLNFGAAEQVVASRELDLPPDSRKGVFLYLPIPQSPTGRIRVRYKTPRGSTVATVEQPLKAVSGDTHIICGISTLPPKLPPEQGPGGKTIYQRLYLQLDQIPDRLQGLEMFDAIIMTPPPFVPLPLDRASALRDWVLRGGVLVVDASERSDVFLQGLFPKMLPFQPQGTEEAELSLFGKNVPFARGTVQRGEVLLESDGHPLVVRTPMGLGSVTCFAIAPNAPVLTTWDGGEALWREILDNVFTGVRQDQNTFDKLDNRKDSLRALVQEPQRVGLRLGLVLLLTAIYALAVGPGDYLLVKWLKRPKLTWVTFPTMVAVFTIASYMGAKAWVGGEMASANARRLLILPKEHVALQYDVVSLFAPGGRDYVLRHEDEAPLYNIRSMSFDDAALRLNQDDNSLTQRIPIWQSRVFGCDTTLTDYPAVDVQLSRVDGKLTATIVNNSDLRLFGGKVNHGLGSWRVPKNVDPGESVSVTLDGPSNGHNLGVPALSHIGLTGEDAWAHGRQFDVRRALGRGAVFVHFQARQNAPNPLIVDGTPRSETGTQIIQVLTYEDGNS